MKQVMAGAAMKKTGIGIGTSILTYFSLLAILALSVVNGKLGEDNIGLCISLAALLSAVPGAAIAMAGEAKPLALYALFSGGMIAAVLLTGCAVNGVLDVPRAAAISLSVLAGAAAALLLRGKGKKKKKRSRR